MMKDGVVSVLARALTLARPTVRSNKGRARYRLMSQTFEVSEAGLE